MSKRQPNSESVVDRLAKSTLTVHEVQKAIGKCRPTINRLINKGHLSATRVGHRIHITTDSVERLLGLKK